MAVTTPLPGTFVSQLPTATGLTGTELIPIVQGGTTKTTTLLNIVQAFGVGSQTPWLSNINGNNFTLTNAKVLATGSTTARTLDVRFGEVVNVKDYGAKGDGVTDDTTAIQNAVNACFANVLASQTPNPPLNKILYFPAGLYIISTHISFHGIWGGVIMGAGNAATQIQNTTASDAVFYANGFRQCVVRDMTLICANNGQCFNLDWDGSTYISTSEVRLDNIDFNGPGSSNGSTGLSIGNSGFQCSEIIVIGCVFQGHNIGMATHNDNAIDISVIGGGAASNGSAYAPQTGSIDNFIQLSLAGNNIDIDFTNGRASSVFVGACRTESVNFIKTNRGKFFVTGCLQACATAGVFFNDGGQEVSHVDCCTSYNGQIGMYGGGHVSNTDIGRDDWFNTATTARFTFENIHTGVTSGGVGTGTSHFLFGPGYVLNGVAYRGFAWASGIQNAADNLAPLVNFSSNQVLISNNNNDGLYLVGVSGANIGGDAYQGQHNTLAFWGGGNNNPSPANGDLITQYYGYGNNSSGLNGFYTYGELQVEIDNVTAGSERGRWVFYNKLAGVNHVQAMRIGNGVVVGTGTTFPGQGNLAAGGTLATGTLLTSNLPAAGTAGRTYFVTNATTNTFGTVVAGAGTFGVPVYDDGTNWRIG